MKLFSVYNDFRELTVDRICELSPKYQEGEVIRSEFIRDAEKYLELRKTHSDLLDRMDLHYHDRGCDATHRAMSQREDRLHDRSVKLRKKLGLEPITLLRNTDID